MSKPTPRFKQILRWVLFCVFQAGWLPGALYASELLPPGFRPLPLGVHALVGGRVGIKPGEVMEEGTIIIRDGFIKAVGKEVTPPPTRAFGT